jgi:cell wall assembly regulator SMI1
MLLINSAEQIKAEDIAEFENEVGIKFPEDYKRFMLKSNGGTPKEEWLYDFFDEVTEAENTSVIREFFSLFSDNSVKMSNLREIYKIMTYEETISTDMLPIADDPGGNIIGISLNKDDFGYVYFINHEYDDLDTGYLVKSKIAESFSNFIGALYLDED